MIDPNDAFVCAFFVLSSGVQAGLCKLVLFGVNFAEPVLVIGWRRAVARVDSRGSREVRDVSAANVSQ